MRTCPTCQRKLPNYYFFHQRGEFNRAKLFFVRPLEDIKQLCFECAGPYRCFVCGQEHPAADFRVGGRICQTCKSSLNLFTAGAKRLEKRL